MPINQMKAMVTHQRTRPIAHHLKASTTWFEIQINKAQQLRWLETFPYLFRTQDHGLLKLNPQDSLDSVKQFCLSKHLTWPLQAQVLLYAQPSFLGYNFNPISLYVILDQHQKPVIILAEVSNTYREQKIYILTDQDESGQFELETPKHFYISPFITVKGSLKISVHWQAGKLVASVLSYEDDQLTLSAFMQGHCFPSTLLTRLKSLVTHPLLAMRVMLSIHWHALLLYLKGVPYFSKSQDLPFQKDIFHAQNHAIRKKE